MEDKRMSREKVCAILAITSLITSTLAGFGCAIVKDFYPNLTSIGNWLFVKAAIGTVFSFFMTIGYLENKRY